MRHTLPLAVLDRLVRERLDALLCVPPTHRPPQRAAPAAEALDERRELEEVRAGSAHARERGERCPARRLVASSLRPSRARRSPGRSSAPAPPRSHATISSTARTPSWREAPLDRLRVRRRELALGRVVAAALRTEDEEAVELRPCIDGPREAARRVCPLARQRCRLRRRAACANRFRYDIEPPFGCAGGARARRGAPSRPRARRGSARARR